LPSWASQTSLPSGVSTATVSTVSTKSTHTRPPTLVYPPGGRPEKKRMPVGQIGTILNDDGESPTRIAARSRQASQF
jgi:hypothetical protein